MGPTEQSCEESEKSLNGPISLISIDLGLVARWAVGYLKLYF